MTSSKLQFMADGLNGKQTVHVRKLAQLVPKHIQGVVQILHHNSMEMNALETRRGLRPAMISLVLVR